MSEALERNPHVVEDPIERARLLFTQWYVDEVTGAAEAPDYTNRRLAESAFTLTRSKRSRKTTLARRVKASSGESTADGRLRISTLEGRCWSWCPSSRVNCTGQRGTHGYESSNTTGPETDQDRR